MDHARLEGVLSGPGGAVPALRRLYAASLPALGEEVELGAEAAQHARVLRLEPADEVSLFDGRGGSVPARVLTAERGSLRCVGLAVPSAVARTSRVVLVQCLPKAGKLDDIVRMTTELGVAAIALAISEYCVARPARADEHRLERLSRIAVEAARQSEQPFVPELRAPRALAEVIALAPESAFRAAFVERSAAPLPELVQEDELWLVVGPEGGLSVRDRELLAAAHFASIALGRSILRTETAAVVGVALALERLGRRR